MIGIVSRLTDQKGFDLIAYVMDELCQDAIQLVILGTGDERYENMFRHFDWKYHGKVSAQIYYDEKMSHRIYASADAFLMPSLFEPCGLSQLMSLRYGTLPIVRETGGLKDTVVPYNEYEEPETDFLSETTMRMRCLQQCAMRKESIMIRNVNGIKWLIVLWQLIFHGVIPHVSMKKCTTG